MGAESTFTAMFPFSDSELLAQYTVSAVNNQWESRFDSRHAYSIYHLRFSVPINIQ